MARLVIPVSAISALVYLATALALARAELGGPPHAELWLAGGVPATIYLPADASGRMPFADPPPAELRPPALVVMHGFAGDRNLMSGISRRLADAGFAVLDIDARGHGQNRNPYHHVSASPDTFAADLAAAVDFLRAYPFVDGSRIALLGHSMGAGAVLDYATRDSGIDAAVMISGGWTLLGPYRPPNALFLYAAGDPAAIARRGRELAARLAGEAPGALELDRTYGSIERADAVRVHEVAHADHQTILWSADAVGQIARWLDAAFGLPPGRSAVPADPRAPLAGLLALALLLALPGLGLLVAPLLREAPPLPAGERGRGLLALVAAFVLTMPLLAAGAPAAIVSAEVGDAVVSQFALAGIVLLVGIRLFRPWLLRGLLAGWTASLAGAAVGVVGIFVLMQPFGPLLHRLTLTPERMLVFAMALPGFFLLALPFNLLLRRGPTRSATLYALAGRLVVLGVLAAGVATGVLGFVVVLMLPALALVFLLFEALAAALYDRSHDLLGVSLIDAAWLAVVVAAILPVRI